MLNFPSYGTVGKVSCITLLLSICYIIWKKAHDSFLFICIAVTAVLSLFLATFFLCGYFLLVGRHVHYKCTVHVGIFHMSAHAVSYISDTFLGGILKAEK